MDSLSSRSPRIFLDDWASLETLFLTRDARPVTSEEIREHSVRLLLLSFYFDQIVVDPGFFLASFSTLDKQFAVLPELFATPIARVLIGEQILVTFGDRFISPIAHAHDRLAHYKDRKMFLLNEDDSWAHAHKNYYARFCAIPRDIVSANQATLLKIQSYRDELARRGDALGAMRADQIILSASNADGYDHQWHQNELNKTGVEKTDSKVLDLHQESKSSASPDLVRCKISQDGKRPITYGRSLYSPYVFAALIDSVFKFKGGVIDTLMRIDDEIKVIKLVNAVRRSGFSDEYNAALECLPDGHWGTTIAGHSVRSDFAATFIKSGKITSAGAKTVLQGPLALATPHVTAPIAILLKLAAGLLEPFFHNLGARIEVQIRYPELSGLVRSVVRLSAPSA